MTREEAAYLLENLIGMVEDNQENDYDDALKMAIEALRNLEDLEKKYDSLVIRFQKKQEPVRCKECKHKERTAGSVDGSAQSETTKEYNLKNIYNIYVKIAQAHFVYQPSKPKTITAMPFDWLETQNLLEKYLKDHGADFDALCREYVSDNVKDDYLPSAQSKRINKGIHEITESDKISYSVICDKFPSPQVYFNTYAEAKHWAKFDQPNYRPYYIIERSEHFEILGEVR